MKIILLIICLLAIGAQSYSRIIYVKANATGLNNGSSWANAFTKFDSVCSYQRDTTIPDTVWVANGVYHPPYNSKFGYLMYNNGLKIYGGFNGTETSLNQRNWTNFQTVLDGEIGSPSTLIDNPRILSININYRLGDKPLLQGEAGNPARPKFVLDGFKFISGNAPLSYGGGMGGGLYSTTVDITILWSLQIVYLLPIADLLAVHSISRVVLLQSGIHWLIFTIACLTKISDIIMAAQ